LCSKELRRAFFKEVFLGRETIGQWGIGAREVILMDSMGCDTGSISSGEKKFFQFTQSFSALFKILLTTNF